MEPIYSIAIALIITEPLKVGLRPIYDWLGPAISFAMGAVKRKDEVNLSVMLNNGMTLLNATYSTNVKNLDETRDLAEKLYGNLHENLLTIFKNKSITYNEYSDLKSWFSSVYILRQTMYTYLAKAANPIVMSGPNRVNQVIVDTMMTAFNLLNSDESTGKRMMMKIEGRLTSTELFMRHFKNHQIK